MKTITFKELLQMIALAVFLSLLIVGISYLAKYVKQKINYQDYKKESEKLQSQNDSLLNQINKDKIMIHLYQQKIDSIGELKKKVIIKYIEKRNEIDNYNSNNLVSEFDSIFTNAGIK